MTDRVAGVDEAGRGPLAGPVVVAAVILDPGRPINGLADSKALSAKRREQLAEQIRGQASAFALAVIEPAEIDRLNILQATLEGMRQAIAGLAPAPDRVLIDGNQVVTCVCPVDAVVGGDRLHPEISAASILAKTHRDALMLELHERFPAYGFDRHKGYPTRQHLDALTRLGPCPAHRQSFSPVRQMTLFQR
ncbi:MAG: ribonuclease HII [Wenzhouxiangella sp.]